ncbi:hypothetical protein C804_03503 [Lachnospiraceae bacterium A4]|nr:hypothetical protein C804_03503 [Lachnospiraceae bacterium A4]
MKIKFKNNSKVKLRPFYNDDVGRELNGRQLIENAISIIDPVYKSGKNVTATDENGNQIIPDVIAALILTDSIDAGIKYKQNKILNDVWGQTLCNYKNGLRASQVFISQANASVNAPLPSSTVIYVPSDLKSACKEYLKTGAEDELCVNTYFYINEPHPVFYFRNNTVYDKYIGFIKSMVNGLSVHMDINTIRKFADFEKLRLKLIEGVILRNTREQGCSAYSFERLVMNFSMMFARQNPDDCGIIAPSINNLLVPRCMLFMNVENVSKVPANKIVRDVSVIKSALMEDIFQLSLTQISKLSAAALHSRIVGMKLKNHAALLEKQGRDTEKRKIFQFSKVAMTKADLSRRIVKIIDKESNVSKSENYSKVIKSTYMKSNRRNPDNYNLPGKSISLQYKPDIHIYLDTSTSISEENYKNAILTCITMAKKLNVNLYFNSFSHVISESTRLKIKGKTITEIYRQFQRVPKVTGGTSFEIVWQYIMQSAKRRKEISLLVTDFAYYPPDERPDYPRKLYYAPIDTSKASWPNVKQAAEEFCRSMYHIEPNICRHILMPQN